MRKYIALTLASVMTVGTLAGCGLFSAKDAGSAQSASGSVSEPPAQSASAPVENVTAAPLVEKSPEIMTESAQGNDQTEYAETEVMEAYEEAAPYAVKETAMPLAASADACTDSYYDDSYYNEEDFNTEEYSTLAENSFRSVITSPLSTFAADVDTASYSNLRRMIMDDYTLDDIPSGAVRTEEIINYFKYDHKDPENGEPFGVTSEIAPCPWNEDHELLMLGLKTEDIDFSDTPDSNLVFLIDTSGSMSEDLDLLKQAFTILVDELDEKDTVSIVTYAGSEEVLLEGVSCDKKSEITDALDSLEAYGSTNGAAGIKTAYELASEYFTEGGNNRVILATDGDLNVGVTSESELHDLITEEAKSGVFLSVLGFGWGNYSDTNLETLADDGNGNYAYIDSVQEAKKVLVEELGSTLLTVAKDVKLQVEFNPAHVSEYRLIGYENRTMAAEDFDDDTKDGGEIGAGHTVTVLYELIPVGAESGNDESSGLRYQEQSVTDDETLSDEWLTLSVRYKDPKENYSRLLEYPIGKDAVKSDPSGDFRFAAAAAEFGMVLHNSEYIGNGSLDHVYQTLKGLEDTDEYQDEFLYMVGKLKRNS